MSFDKVQFNHTGKPGQILYFYFVLESGKWITITQFLSLALPRLPRNLQEEYDQLKQASEDASPSVLDGDDDSRDSEMIAEAKLLRQHKGRLEARMQILEDHNRQLEAQLQRLRQLLDQVRVCLTLCSLI